MLFKAIVADAFPENAPGPTDDFWYHSVGQTSAGVRVTAMSAMKASAAYACIKVLSETLATLPRLMYAYQSDGAVKAYPQHPLQDVIDLQPNDQQTAVEFWEMQIAFGALFGNSYARIVPGARGFCDQLVPMRPDYMRVLRAKDGTLRFEYTDPFGGQKTTYMEDEIFRIPGFSFNGVEGIAPIFFASDPIGLSLAAERFGGKFFTHDATPALALEHPKPLKPEAVKNIKASWAQAHQGPGNAYSVAVLEEGMTVKPLGIANKDAQFLETRRYQIAEIARYFRIPLHMINELEKSTYSNIEQQGIEFLKYTVRPWLRRIEQRTSMQLISAPDKFYMRHNVDELVMGEVTTRYASYASGINAGWLTRNEVRLKEGLNPLPGLNEPLTPMNMGGDQPGTPPVPKQPPANQSRVAAQDIAGGIFVRDAFERISQAERRAVEELTHKHSGEALVARLEAFYQGKHAAYVEKTLAPVEAYFSSKSFKVTPSAEYAITYAAAAVLEIDSALITARIVNWTDHAQTLTQDYLKMEITNAE